MWLVLWEEHDCVRNLWEEKHERCLTPKDAVEAWNYLKEEEDKGFVRNIVMGIFHTA